MAAGEAAVLLMAYGAASSPEEVPAYLRDIRGGKPAAPELIEEVRRRYRIIGGRSPLLDITRAQAGALAARLGHKVYVGMRHSAPTLLDAVQDIRAAGHSRVVALALTPYYSKLSAGDYLARYREAVDACAGTWTTLPVESWSRHPAFLSAWARKVREGIARFPEALRAGARVLFTAHSLPAHILNDGDPYPTELARAAEEVARGAGLAAWEFAYQSRGRTSEPWLGPDAGEVLARLAGAGCKALLLAPIGFISDHLETLYDDDVLYRDQAAALGVRFERADTLNDAPDLIEALADVVIRRLHGGGAP